MVIKLRWQQQQPRSDDDCRLPWRTVIGRGCSCLRAAFSTWCTRLNQCCCLTPASYRTRQLYSGVYIVLPPHLHTRWEKRKFVFIYQVGDMVDYSLIFAVISCSEWGRKPTRVDDDDDETLCVRNVFWGWKDMDEKREPPCQFEQAVGDP